MKCQVSTLTHDEICSKGYSLLIIFLQSCAKKYRKLVSNLKFHKVKLLKFQSFNFDLKFLWNWSFFHYEKIMRFKNDFSNLELEGQGQCAPKLIVFNKFIFLERFKWFLTMKIDFENQILALFDGYFWPTYLPFPTL